MATIYKSAVCEETGVKLNVYYDESAINPREGDNIGKMVCWHRHYGLGDEHNYDSAREFLEDLAIELSRLEYNEIVSCSHFELLDIIKKRAVILPIYMYEHSGIAINTTGFSCPWDSGCVGWIYCTHEDFLKNTMYTEQELFDEGIAEKMLQAEVEVYGHYLSGEVFGFVLEDRDGNEISSCWGFYGSDFMTNGMKDEIPNEYMYLLNKLEYVRG